MEVAKDGGRDERRSEDVRVVVMTAAAEVVVGTSSCFRS